MRRVGDPSKELSTEYSITLATSLAPSNTYTYPLKYAPSPDLSVYRDEQCMAAVKPVLLGSNSGSFLVYAALQRAQALKPMVMMRFACVQAGSCG